ncbi:MAG: sugar phosphate nucleotidyltransferase [Candidatus Nomurabacteria bacterium]|nr:sugar phosphate nucleotidyltransferase [Candidatus Nomurabacteria bacterium]
MKGIILAGGRGGRLLPLTKITNKHLLPIYDKQMILYPLATLKNAGIKDILIISGRPHVGDFLKLLGSGRELGIKISYEIQEEELGIANALSLAESFVNGDKMTVILGDNIFEDDVKNMVHDFEKQKEGAVVFLKEVEDPNRFGVAEIKNEKIIKIEEKPKKPKTNLAVTGLYMYDNTVFDFIRKLTPSTRGEFEITDVNNFFINKGKMKHFTLKGNWTDAGTFESLFRATNLARKLSLKNKL